MSDLDDDDLSGLLERAKAAQRHAYAPYSGFEMGAAVLGEDGRVVEGAIVENVSLGLAMCAERVALFAASASGVRPVALALVARTTAGEVTWPCGACLQVALELGGRDLIVVAGNGSGERGLPTTVGELLPRGPKVK